MPEERIAASMEEMSKSVAEGVQKLSGKSEEQSQMAQALQESQKLDAYNKACIARINAEAVGKRVPLLAMKILKEHEGEDAEED